MELEDLIGQKLMIGVPGTELTPAIVELFRETRAGGLILFRPNFSSAEGLKRLIADLEAALVRRIIIAVDHEGGRVIHLAEGVSVFPDNLALGKTRNEDYAKTQGEIDALELRRLGIDLNLAPTLDVLTETFSPNIGIRSYGGDPGIVARLGTARIKGMQAFGLSACAKHFPGQGQSPLDAHLALPVLPTTWEEMWKIHIKPFVDAIKAGVEAVMSSHPVYPNLDPLPLTPATFSKKIITECLRKELGFQGAILTDDLEMGALKDICPIGESACRATEAGHDILLICHKAEAVREVYQSLLDAYRNKRLDAAELELSVERIHALKEKRPQRFAEGAPLPEVRGKELAAKIAGEAVRIFKNHTLLPLRRHCFEDDTVSVIFPKLSSLSHLVMIEPECLDERNFIRNAFKRHGVNPDRIEIVGLDPSDDEIRKACESAGAGTLTLYFCYDAHLFPRGRKLLEEIQTVTKPCVVILLRDPYDEEFVKPEAACVTAFGFRAAQIQAAVDVLFSQLGR